MATSLELTNYVLELACTIQQIQAPTFHEKSRADWMLTRFQQEQLLDVHFDAVGNVLGRIPGGPSAPLIISAHLDTVHPLQESLGLSWQEDRITGAAIGDDSLGLAALLGIIRWARLETFSPPGDLWLVATVGEEGLGNLHGMQAIVDRFQGEPVAYLVLEGIGLGNLHHRGLGVERYRISIQTAGGHSWTDYGSPSAIHELAKLVVQLTRLSLPKTPRTTLNVGKIQGGIAINAIAAQAFLELDLRSEDQSTLIKVVRRVQKKVHRLQKNPQIQVRMEQIGSRPAGEIPESHPLIQLAIDLNHRHGISTHLSAASTDANIPLSRGYPSICFGLTTGGNTHTSNEYIQTQPLSKGLAFLFSLIQSVWGTITHNG